MASEESWEANWEANSEKFAVRQIRTDALRYAVQASVPFPDATGSGGLADYVLGVAGRFEAYLSDGYGVKE